MASESSRQEQVAEQGPSFIARLRSLFNPVVLRFFVPFVVIWAALITAALLQSTPYAVPPAVMSILGVSAAFAAGTFTVFATVQLRGLFARYEAERLLAREGSTPSPAAGVHWLRAQARVSVLSSRWVSTGLIEIGLGVALAGLAAVLFVGMLAPVEYAIIALPVLLCAAIWLPGFLRVRTLWPLGWLFTREQRRLGSNAAGGFVLLAACFAFLAMVFLENGPLSLGVGAATLSVCLALFFREFRYAFLAVYLLGAPVFAANLNAEPAAFWPIVLALMALGVAGGGLWAYGTLLYRLRHTADVDQRVSAALAGGCPDDRALAAWVVGIFAARGHFAQIVPLAFEDYEWAAYEAVAALDMLWGAPPEVRHRWLLDAERQESGEVSPQRAEELLGVARHDSWEHVRAYRVTISAAASLDPSIAENAKRLLKDPRWEWMTTGARVLGSIGTDDALRALCRAITNGPRPNAIAASLGFVDVPVEKAGHLEPLVVHRHTHVRAFALRAVAAVVDGARMEGESEFETAREWATKVFSEAVAHPSSCTRMRAAINAASLGEAAKDLQRPLLSDPRWGVRGAALIGLCRSGADAWRSDAELARSDDHPWVRRIAEELLAAD